MPAYCQRIASQAGFALSLSVVIVGALICCSVAGVLAYRWQTVMKDNQKRHPVSLVSALVISVIALFRIFRIVEFRAFFFGSQNESDVWFIINQIILLPMMIVSTMLFLMLKLRSAFKGTTLAIPSSHLRRMRVMIVICAVGIFLTVTLIRLFSFYVDWPIVGISLILIFAVITLSMALYIVGFMDYSFVTRLSKLVANSTRSSATSSHIHRFKQTMSVSSADISADHGSVNNNHGGGSTMNTMTKTNTADFTSNDTGHSPSVSASVVNSPRIGLTARNATISDFQRSEQRILETAAKSTVLALSITLSFILLGMAGVVFTQGHCTQWPTVMGYVIYNMSTVILSVSVLLGFQHSRKEYDLICSFCNSRFRSVVATNTNSRILKSMNSADENVDHVLR